MAGWALFAHDADVGVRGSGPTREAAFEQGAIALMQAMGAGGDVAPQQMVSIACEPPDEPSKQSQLRPAAGVEDVFAPSISARRSKIRATSAL
ncbi:MAG TPA: archease [Geminicoccaceae bacterium]